jgi:putative SOS response-associated peptidase YedK
MAALHDRMPAILERWPVWLGEAEGEDAALLRAAPDGLLRVWPVDRRVGSPRKEHRWLDGAARIIGRV